MTKIVVDTGICGFPVTITVDMDKNKKIHLFINTECEMVEKMLDDISTIDLKTAFKEYLDNQVYLSAGKHIRHVACPVPSGILKAIEVEAGICLPRDVGIKFLESKK